MPRTCSGNIRELRSSGAFIAGPLSPGPRTTDRREPTIFQMLYTGAERDAVNRARVRIGINSEASRRTVGETSRARVGSHHQSASATSFPRESARRRPNSGRRPNLKPLRDMYMRFVTCSENHLYQLRTETESEMKCYLPYITVYLYIYTHAYRYTIVGE